MCEEKHSEGLRATDIGSTSPVEDIDYDKSAMATYEALDVMPRRETYSKTVLNG